LSTPILLMEINTMQTDRDPINDTTILTPYFTLVEIPKEYLC
jgi:hypothetical protein